MSRHKFADFEIVMRTLPDNWDDIVKALYAEGIWPADLMSPIDNNCEFPIPSDGALRFEDGFAVLEGSAMCGGGSQCGHCIVKYPKDSIDHVMHYAVQVSEDDFEGDSIDRFEAILKKYGVQYIRR